MNFEILPLSGAGGLFDVLTWIPDPRSRGGIRFPSRALLATAICAHLSEHKSFRAIAEWISDQPTEIRTALGFTRREAPSEKTIRMFLQRLDVQTFSARISKWFSDILEVESQCAIAIDGKTLRGSLSQAAQAVQLVSAVTHGRGVTISQDKIEGGNEIKAAQNLIAGLELCGKTVTLDALHTQKDTAALIANLKLADYVMTVKDNQPTLREGIANAPIGAFSPCIYRNGQRSRPHRRKKH